MPDNQVWVRLGRGLPDGELDVLGERFPGVRFTAGEAPPDDVDVVFTNQLLPDETTERLRALKWIHTTFGGGAAFRTPLVDDRGIAVTSSRGVQAEPLTEYTEACVLAFAKRFPTLWRNQQERRWDETLALDSPVGQVAGLLGLGAMGSLVARRLHDRGMRVRAIRRNVADVPPYVERVTGWEGLPALLAEADFLIVALPGESLRGRIGAAELRAMKPTSYLINLVTREITPDAALARALHEGWIAGAACNVFEQNPLPADSPLWAAPNLIISPNVAHGDPRRWLKLKDVFTENLRRYLNGERLLNVVGGERASY